MLVLIDATYLCHQCHMGIGSIKRNGQNIEVVFGVLREAVRVYEMFKPESMVWCFDSRYNLRKEAYTGYKANRSKEPSKKILWRQIDNLRKSQLKAVGFRNVVRKNGYEADDLIAYFVKKGHFSTPIVIVSADSDLQQLLAENVKIYNPRQKKMYTKDDFMAKWGIEPSMWSTVKAIAGDSSDNIMGITGVGYITAIQYLKGTLSPRSAKYKAIAEREHLIKENLKLIDLPYKGLMGKKIKVKPDYLTREKWRSGLQQIGLDYIPFPHGVRHG